MQLATVGQFLQMIQQNAEKNPNLLNLPIVINTVGMNSEILGFPPISFNVNKLEGTETETSIFAITIDMNHAARADDVVSNIVVRAIIDRNNEVCIVQSFDGSKTVVAHYEIAPNGSRIPKKQLEAASLEAAGGMFTKLAGAIANGKIGELLLNAELLAQNRKSSTNGTSAAPVEVANEANVEPVGDPTKMH